MLTTLRAFRDLPLRAAGFPALAAEGKNIRVVTVAEAVEPGVTLASMGAALFNADGKLTAQWIATPEELQRAPVVGAMSASPGGYRLRVAAIDSTGRSGAADYDVTAEIVSSGPLKLSSLVLGLSRAGGFAPRLQFTTEPLAIAYVELEGAPEGGRLSAALEVSQSLNGPPMVTVPLTIENSGANKYRAMGSVPLGALPAGDYIVRAIDRARGTSDDASRPYHPQGGTGRPLRPACRQDGPRRPWRGSRRDATNRPARRPRRHAGRWSGWSVSALSRSAIRLICLFELRGSPFVSVLIGDSLQYDTWARQIASGDWLGHEVFYQSPLYPYLLAALYRTGLDTFGIRLLQATVGAASCAILAMAGRRFFHQRAGLVAGALLAIYPPAIFYDMQIQKSSTGRLPDLPSAARPQCLSRAADTRVARRRRPHAGRARAEPGERTRVDPGGCGLAVLHYGAADDPRAPPRDMVSGSGGRRMSRC